MAGLNLTLQAGKAPFGTQLPGNAQALLTFIAQYVLIAGGSSFNGINYGASTPAPENRGLPWFKTDQFGNPIGLFAWNGASWVAIPVVIGNGTFANAPQNPSVGTEYFATDLGCLLIFTSSGWSTASGTPGDYKFVEASTSDAALANNPGWSLATNQTGCVLGAAGAATSITAAHPQGQLIGEEAHTLTINELPSHTHPISANQNNAAANGNVGNPSGILADHSATATGSTGGGAAANVIQPTYYTWLLVKKY